MNRTEEEVRTAHLARYDIEVIPLGGSTVTVPWLSRDQVGGAVRSLAHGDMIIISRTDHDAEPGAEY